MHFYDLIVDLLHLLLLLICQLDLLQQVVVNDIIIGFSEGGLIGEHGHRLLAELRQLHKFFVGAGQCNLKVDLGVTFFCSLLQQVNLGLLLFLS